MPPRIPVDQLPGKIEPDGTRRPYGGPASASATPWIAPEDDRFLNSRQVRERYADASDMWLWRRLNDDSGFPKPLDVCGRRFWRLSELIGWERSRAAGEAA
jgi:hypothetical protein